MFLASAQHSRRPHAFGDGTFVVVGPAGLIRTSRNAKAWTAWSCIVNALYGIAASPERYVAVGTNGAMVASEDAHTWFSLPAVTDQELRGAAWGDGVWLAVGASGTVLRSLDGERWQPVSSGVTAELWSAALGPAGWVVVGASGTVLRSADGVWWRRLSSSGSPATPVRC